MEKYNDFATATNEDVKKMNNEYNKKTSILQSDDSFGQIPRQVPRVGEEISTPIAPISNETNNNGFLNTILFYLILKLISNSCWW